MAIVHNIPDKSRPLFPENTFLADFNAPTLGRYDFNDTQNTPPLNTNQLVFETHPANIYFVDRITMTLDIDVVDFKKSLSGGIVPNIRLRLTRANQNIYPTPTRFNNYYPNLELNQWFWSDLQGDTLVADFRGILTQPAGLIGEFIILTAVERAIKVIPQSKADVVGF